MSKRRRNPASSNMLPLLVAGAGVALLIASRNKAPAPVQGYEMWGVNARLDGVGDIWSKAKKKAKSAVKSVTNVALKPVVLTTKVVSKLPGGAIVNKIALAPIAIASSITSKLPGGKILAAVSPTNAIAAAMVVGVKKGKRSPAPPPGSNVEYQDENGNVITKAEYERRQAIYEAMSACEAQKGRWSGSKCMRATEQPPGKYPSGGIMNPSDCAAGQSRFGDPNGQCMTYDQWAAAQPQSGGASAPSSGGGGGDSGGGAPDSSTMPAPADAPAPTSADDAAPPAPAGKMNPLVAVAAFAAVPLVLGLTGGK